MTADRASRRSGTRLTWMLAGSMCIATVVASSARQRPDALLVQTPTFRATTDGVRVDVSVRNRNRPVTGLAAADFELYDNGVKQELIGVTFGQVPIDVTVGLDISRSVTGRLLDTLRAAVRDLRGDLRGEDRLKLVSFNMRVLRQTTFTSDRREIESALAALQGTGSTSVFDTIAVTLSAASDPDRRQLIMIFTDGTDTNSITHSSTLFATAERSSAVLGFVIGLPGGRAQAPPVLDRLATETGGQVALVTDDDLSATFRRVLDEFRSSYVLLFRPSGVDPSGFHTLEVRVPASPRHEVRARRGYFGR